ncbi:hypothetical protein K2173_010079 [Erythroxylum novogranatense]|uniref:Potassium transporter n=1 Tax=Erythroxylum novogranatense TaxID=1862640 RepID=A0AAV8T0Y3_9ROSI|nr:hypothetical protein K2173_010079 [Erythroxylum novogranatense]
MDTHIKNKRWFNSKVSFEEEMNMATEKVVAVEEESDKLDDPNPPWPNLGRIDSLNLEAGRVSTPHGHHPFNKSGWKMTLSLAFQSLGVVYGDIGTSPLYVFSSVFSDGSIDNKDDILGVLCLIIYTILLLAFFKYVFIVLWANDNGDGGTFALYSLLCRYAKVSLIPNEQPEDRQLSNYNLKTPSNQLRRGEKIKELMEKSKNIKVILFLVTILGTSMVIGDGVLTPSISVLSAVSGITSLGKNAVLGISIAILVFLFSVQRFGTDKVGFSFYDLGVLRAFYPKYAVDYFVRNGKQAWISLGGVILCITGTEAMFADVGHFNVRAIQISFSGIVMPAILAAYAGQAAYLTKFPNDVSKVFYNSIPDPLYWPSFVVAVAAAIIASQAMISGTFAIISQSQNLGCFPRVKVVHTSTKYEGQVYIPEINYTLMIACVIVCLVFKSTEKIGHAYGIAVVAVMVITTCMVALIMLVIWNTWIGWIAIFFVIFVSIEGVYLSAVLYKFKQGGYLPLVFSFVLMTIMATWLYAHHKRYIYELNNKVSTEVVKALATNPNISRLPGIGLFCSELVQGIPPIFSHFIDNIPCIHSVLVFVSIKSIPISKVAPEERFLFRQVEPRDDRIFRCVVRFGYKEYIEDLQEFEHNLVEQLKEFIRHQHFILEGGNLELAEETESLPQSTQLVKDGKVRGSAVHVEETLQQPITPRISSGSIQSIKGIKSSRSSSNGITVSPLMHGGAGEEIRFIQKAKDKGVVYLVGEADVVAKPQSSLFKKFIVDYAYDFLRKNVSTGKIFMEIPRSKLLRVGMTYEI